MNGLRSFFVILTLSTLAGFLTPHPGAAQWQPNGVPLCTAAGDQWFQAMVSDGAGGAIITWLDERNVGDILAGGDIYAQRVSAAGVPLWGPDGVPISVGFTILRGDPAIAADGAGGAIITWEQYRSTGNFDIYAQRVSAAGVPLWTQNGVALCTAAGYQFNPTVASDGAGGAIVTWDDWRRSVFDVDFFEVDIYAQRVSAAGLPQWVPDGVALCTAPGFQTHPVILSDGSGGAIAVWPDSRAGGGGIYAQRVSAAGVPQWVADGVAVSTAAGYQGNPALVSDGTGGAIITWDDERDGWEDIYAQRVNGAGVPQWALDGVPLCTAAFSQEYPTPITDGAGGAIVTWLDGRNWNYDDNFDIYAQRVSADGVPRWVPNGMPICTAGLGQYLPSLVADGAGGAIIAWSDARSSSGIYAQRVSPAGIPQWTPDGLALCAGIDIQLGHRIASDGAGGALVTWSDQRTREGSADIYAQRVSSAGAVGVIVVGIDIRPGSPDNSLNLNGEGLLPVAVLGARGFDVRDVDLESVRLAGGAVERKEDGRPQAVFGDINGDGLTDLRLKVVVAEMQVGPEDTTAVLAGLTIAGERFTGQDRIRIVRERDAATPFVHEIVDSAGNVGLFASLALDAQGNPHISYFDDTHGDLKYARKSGGVWTIETVDSTGVVGESTSLALDAEGDPHISYVDGTEFYRRQLKYASKSGGVWTLETVHGTGWKRHYTSLALDAQGNPHIVFINTFDDWDLLYVHKSGGTWTGGRVGANEIPRLYPSLALDAEGRPRIGYWDGPYRNLMYASKTGLVWTHETVDAIGNVGEYLSLALDAHGDPRISYLDNTNGDLKYASKSGGVWTLETVDAPGFVGEYTSLALDAEGNPRIAYYDVTNADLKYASKPGGVWARETVDATGDVGQYASLALDGDGNPRISFYDATNGDLKYAEPARPVARRSSVAAAGGSQGQSASSDLPARPLAAWPLPYRGGELTVSFATFSGPGGGASEARVEVYDLSGRRVRALASGRFPAGHRSVTWDGRGDDGRAVANGIYFIRARTFAHDELLKVAVTR